MGSIGRYKFRTGLGAFLVVYPRPFSPASTDSATKPHYPNFRRCGSARMRIFSGIAADFLLFVLSKVMGDLSKGVMYSARMAPLPAIVGRADFNASRYREAG